LIVEGAENPEDPRKSRRGVNAGGELMLGVAENLEDGLKVRMSVTV
jgi:hypothetical protein